eukprot:g8697.t1
MQLRCIVGSEPFLKEKLRLAAEALQPGDRLCISLEPLRAGLLPHIKRLHKERLPVSYGEQYFEEALASSWSKAALYEGTIAGALEMDGGLRVQSLVTAVPRRGIGGRLLQNLCREAESSGIRKLSLHVHDEAQILRVASVTVQAPSQKELSELLSPEVKALVIAADCLPIGGTEVINMVQEFEDLHSAYMDIGKEEVWTPVGKWDPLARRQRAMKNSISGTLK